MEKQIKFGAALPLSLLLALVLLVSPTEGIKCHVCDADVTLIVDTSGSVGSGNFQANVKPFIAGLYERMYASFKRHRVAMFSYDHRVQQVLHFTFNPNIVRNAISNFWYGGGGTATHLALKEAAAYIKSRGRLCKPQLVVFCTDGYSFSPVAPVIGLLHAVADRVIAIGITPNVKMSELNLIAKDAPVIWYSDPSKLRLAIPQIIQHLCRIVHKVCPKPKVLPVRCVNNCMLEYRTIAYFPWNGECWKKTNIRHVKVKCNRKFKPYYVCIRCKRYWVLKYVVIINCKCVLRKHVAFAGVCCCPKPTSHVSCKHTYKKITYIRYTLINGKCWRQKLCYPMRCGCPKGNSKRWCVMHRILVYWNIQYVFVNKKYCRKIITKSVTPVRCRLVRIIAMSKRCFRLYGKHKYGNEFYKKITISYVVMRNCRCYPRLKNIWEPCRCFKKKRWVWIRDCRRICQRICSKQCYRVRVWLAYKLKKYYRNGRKIIRCVPKPIFKQKFRCCCPNRRPKVKRFCKHGRRVTYIFYQRLRSGLCQRICRWISMKVHCRHGILRRTIQLLNDGQYKITEWIAYKYRCKCLTKKRTRYKSIKCGTKCRKYKKCLSGILLVRTKYYILFGFRCIVRVLLIKRQIACPQYKIFIRRRCNPRTKHFVLLYKKAYQAGCRCMLKYIVKSGHHCYCRKKKVTPWKCVRNNMYRRIVISYKLHHGRCIRSRRVETRKITTCKTKIWLTYKCFKESGIRFVYRHRRRLVNCKCIETKKLLRKERCNCIAVNRRHSHVRRIFCDKVKNELVTLTWIYMFDPRTYRCNRKTNEKREKITCNRGITSVRGRCSTHSWERLITRVSNQAVNCVCQRRTRVKKESCKCKPRKTVEICHKDTGVVERTTRSENFDVGSDRCIKTVRVLRQSTQCRSVRILRTRCNGRTYTETILRILRKPGTCVCNEQVTRAIRPCNCPTKTRVTPCFGYYKRVNIIFFKWVIELKKCVILHQISYRLRCKCPPTDRKVKCVRGQKIIEITTNALRYGKCIRRTQIIRQPIVCSKHLRFKKSKCNRCFYTLSTMVHVPRNFRCHCHWKSFYRRRCRCCPCPQSTARIVCADFGWKVIRTSWDPKFIGSCKIGCVPIVFTYFKQVICPPRPRSHWTACVKCVQRWVNYVPVFDHCKCKYHAVITQRTRQCCCTKPPVRRVQCIKGARVISTTTYALRQFECITTRSIESRLQPCPEAENLIRGDCNLDTCLRQIYSERYVRNQATCQCIRTKVPLYREKCCCNRKGYVRRICMGGCWINSRLVVRFDKNRKQCVERQTSDRTCFKCRGPKIHRGRCRSSCYRYVYKREWRQVDCRCRIYITRRSERCCCRIPTQYLKSCRGNTVIRTRTRFVRNGINCTPVTEKRETIVPCRVGVQIRIRMGKCNPRSCEKLVTRTLERRSGCTCVSFLQTKAVKCCCPPDRSRLVCEKNTNLVRVTVSYRLVNDNCMERVTRTTIRQIPRCRSTRTSTKCNKLTKRRLWFKTHYKVVKCRCVKSHVKRRSYPCACRQRYKIFGRCHRRSCRQRVILTWFVYRNRRRCVRKVKTWYRPCCCKKKKWTVKRCNREMGQMLLYQYRYRFYRKIHRCLTFLSILSLGISPNCFNSLPNVRRGKCNLKTGRARDVVTTYQLISPKCRCVRRVRIRTRVCSCKYLGCKTTNECKSGFKVKKVTCWKLLAGSCHAITSITYTLVTCKRNRRCIKKCDPKGCRGTRTCRETRQVNCGCRRNRQVKNILCCCKKMERKVTCENPFMIETITGYILNAKEDKCKRYVTRKRTAVKNCPRKSGLIKGKCNRGTCNRKICVLNFGIRKCKCIVIRKRWFMRKCCCPPRKLLFRCNRRSGIKTHYRKYYTLFDGVCLRHLRVKQTETRCDSIKITVRPCENESRRRIIFLETFRRRGCRCRRFVRRIVQTCRCRPPSIRRVPCKKGQKTRGVIYVYYKLLFVAGRQKCAQRTETLFLEPCSCATPVRKVACESNERVTIIITQKMITQFGQRVCTNIVQRTTTRVVCRKKRITRSGCQGSVRTIRTEEWFLSNCHCHRSVRTRREACECHKKNSVQRVCRMGVKFVISISWITKPGHRECHMTRIVVSHPVRCPKCRTVPLTRSCPVKQGYGFYRKYVVTCYVKQKCRCLKRKKFILRLCRCRRSFTRRRCTGSAIVYKKFSYFAKYNWCFCKLHVTRSPIRCLLPRASLRASACRRVTRGGLCKRSITVTERRVRKCVCKSNLRRFSQICCAPRATTRKYCDTVTGYRVKEEIFSFLRSTGAFYNQDGVFISRRVVRSRKIVTRRRVVCPASSRKVTCDKRTGVKTITWLRVKRTGCKCTESRIVTKGKCKCPPPKTKKYNCMGSSRRVDYIYYIVENDECKPRIVIRMERCRCPRKRFWTFCHRITGARVTCRRRFTFIKASPSPYCRRFQRCRSHPLKCPMAVTTRGPCNKKTGLQIVRETKYIHNRRRCHCDKNVRKWSVSCSCHHLNKTIKRCNDGYIEQIKKVFVLSNGHCIMVLTRNLREVVCRATSVRLLKDCRLRGPNAGRFTRLTIRYDLNRAGCSCKRRIVRDLLPCICRLIPGCKPRITRRCVRNVTIIRTDFCKLVNGKCEKRWKVVRKTIPVGQIKNVRGKCKRNKRGNYYIITYYKKVLKRCHPVWVIIGTKKRICKCPPKRVIRKCYNHWQIVIMVIRFFRHESRAFCRSQSTLMTIFRRCNSSYVRRDKCNPRTCRRRITKCYYRAYRCKCRKRVIRSFRRCCCRGPTPRNTRCASDGRTLVTRWVTYNLFSGNCFRVFHAISKRLECETKAAVVKIDRACQRNFRRVTTTTFVTRQCACIPKTRIRNFRCDCASRLRLTRGTCVGRWTIDRQYSLKYNPKIKKCIWILIKKLRRLCRCPDDTRVRKCVRHDTFVDRTVTYDINLRLNRCVKKVTRSTHPIGRCKRKRSLIRIVFGRCLKSNNYIQTDLYFYRMARNCECKTTRKIRRWPCNCYDAKKPVRTERCINNNVKHIKVVAHENRGKKCVTKKFLRRVAIVCVGRRVRRSACIHGFRRILEHRRVVRNCSCHWRAVRQTKVPCSCPKKVVSRTCMNNKIVRTVETRFKLANDKCFRTVVIRNRPTPCHVGTYETRSSCRNNRSIITKTTSTLKDCKCLRHVATRQCRCRCPKPYRFLKCWRRRHVWCEINIIHILKNCVCISIKKVRKLRLSCKSSAFKRTACRLHEGGDGYRWYKQVIARRQECKCKRRVARWKKLCSCAPRIKRKIQCRRNTLRIITLTKRILRKGKCQRVEYRRRVIRIVCKRPTTKITCKNGIKSVVTKTRYLVNCECGIRVAVKNSKCECDSKDRLIRISTCQKCKRTLFYSRRILRNGSCVPRRWSRSEVCCCNSKITKTRSCNARGGVITERLRKLVLKNGKCVPRVTVRRTIIICVGVSFQIYFGPNGFIIQIQFYYVILVSSCKCVRRSRRKIIGRWKCPTPSVRIRCLNQRTWERTKTAYKLVNKACMMNKEVRRIPVYCPFTFVQFKPCQSVPYGWARLIIRRWYVRNKCKCDKRVHTTYILCRCWPNRVRSKCNRRTGVLTTIDEKFVPEASQRRCRRLGRSFSRSTRCDPRWRIIERYRCFVVYRRSIRRGCKCIIEFKRKSIRVKCPKKKVKRGACNYRNCLRATKFTVYKARKCQCTSRVYYQRQPCFVWKCPTPRTIRGPCVGGVRKDRLVFYRKVRCRCKKFNRIINKIAKCHVVHEYAIGPCKNGVQLFVIVRYKRKRCACIPIRSFIKKFCACRVRKTEVIFVLGSGFFDFPLSRKAIANFLKGVIASEPIGMKFVRAAVVRTCRRRRLLINLHQNHPHLSITVSRLLLRISPRRCRRVYLGAALRTVRRRVLPRARDDALKLVVIITKGKRRIADPVTASHEAQKLKSEGVLIKAIAVKPGFAKKQRIKSLVSNPKYTRFTQTSSVTHLYYFKKFVHDHMCPAIIY